MSLELLRRKASHLLLVVLVSLVSGMMCSCSAGSDDVTTEGQKSRVQVAIRGLSFDVQTGEPLSRGETLSSAATRLSFAVFDSDGNQMETVNQESSDEDFGTAQMELFPGTYQMAVVAHNGDNHAVIASTTSATLPGNTITDTFAKVEEFTVKSNEDCSLEVTIPRITSAFVLRLKDSSLPNDLEEIQVVVNTAGTAPSTLEFSPSTGFASYNWKVSHTIPVADLKSDIPIYFISLLSEVSVNVKATAYDTLDKEIISHTISNVPLNSNQKTIATGYFFQSEGSVAFTLETTWQTDEEIDY